MSIDKEVTSRLFDEYFATFDERTNPEEIDFFLSAVCCSYLVNGYSVHSQLEYYSKLVLERAPQAFVVNPGVLRSQRSGRFDDSFDQQFEDGFNPLAFYFYNAPSQYRRRLSYSDYLKSTCNAEDLLPFYWDCLRYFEQTGRTSGALRVVHALGQMISMWPIEGLAAIKRLVGRTDPLIRRGIVRVLAEAYSRFPSETASIIAESGGSLTEDERYSIRCGVDPRLLERSFEQVHWARILNLLRYGGVRPDFVWKLTEALTHCTSLPEALTTIVTELVTATVI